MVTKVAKCGLDGADTAAGSPSTLGCQVYAKPLNKE
jgi:hypothetical protein